jgi:hypothetical protein
LRVLLANFEQIVTSITEHLSNQCYALGVTSQACECEFSLD